MSGITMTRLENGGERPEGRRNCRSRRFSVLPAPLQRENHLPKPPEKAKAGLHEGMGYMGGG